MSTNRLLPSPPQDAEVVDLHSEVAALRSAQRKLDLELFNQREALEAFKNQVVAMLQGARIVFDGHSPTATESEVPQPIPTTMYDAWKSRLPPACGKIIDALLVQPMNNSQLKKFCGLGTSTVPQMVTILIKNGLVEKAGDLNRLRRP